MSSNRPAADTGARDPRTTAKPRRPEWHLTWRPVTVRGRPARYGEAGPPDGRPVVFLHGWGLADHAYKRALNRLAKHGLWVLAPSLPGFGGTADLPKEEFGLDGYADWVVDFADAVGIEGPFVLAGHSFGGGVAIKAAHLHPDRVGALILVNSIGGAVWKAGETPETSRHMAERPLWDWGMHFPQDVTRRRTLSKVLPVIAEDVFRNVLKNPGAFWRVGRLARTADLRAELEDLRDAGKPVVVIWGHEDQVLPSASLDALVDALGSRPVVAQGSHSWLLSDPDQFGELMTNVVGLVHDVEDRVDADAEGQSGLSA